MFLIQDKIKLKLLIKNDYFIEILNNNYLDYKLKILYNLYVMAKMT